MLFFYQYDIKDGVWVSRDSDHVITQNEFYSQNFDPNEKRVFIMGSSQVVPLNATYIKEYISVNNHDYEIYNLATISDLPMYRLETLDMIISTKPEIVAYGISDRDFTFSQPSRPSSFLPDPHQFFVKLLDIVKNSIGYDVSVLESPQRVTLLFIIDFVNKFDKEKSEVIPYENTPFMRIPKSATIIKNDVGFRRTGFDNIIPPEKNVNVIALKEIIKKLQENNIKVIVFIIPQNKFYSDPMPDVYKKSFNSILDDLHTIPNLKIYDLYYKYKDLNIWGDLTHVAINRNATIYSEDVARMILEEINS